MDAQRLRAFLLTLPHAIETMQWGDNLLFWVGDKAIGGKMFALINLETSTHGLVSYPAGPQRFPDLLEIDGLKPAPYMARNFWVAAERWDAFSTAEWHRELRAAHDLTLAKLPPRTRKVLALPAAEQRNLIAKARAKPPARKK